MLVAGTNSGHRCRFGGVSSRSLCSHRPTGRISGSCRILPRWLLLRKLTYFQAHPSHSMWSCGMTGKTSATGGTTSLISCRSEIRSGGCQRDGMRWKFGSVLRLKSVKKSFGSPTKALKGRFSWPRNEKCDRHARRFGFQQRKGQLPAVECGDRRSRDSVAVLPGPRLAWGAPGADRRHPPRPQAPPEETEEAPPSAEGLPQARHPHRQLCPHAEERSEPCACDRERSARTLPRGPGGTHPLALRLAARPQTRPRLQPLRFYHRLDRLPGPHRLPGSPHFPEP